MYRYILWAASNVFALASPRTCPCVRVFSLSERARFYIPGVSLVRSLFRRIRARPASKNTVFTKIADSSGWLLYLYESCV